MAKHTEYVIYREIGKTREYYAGILPYKCSPTCRGNGICKHRRKKPGVVDWRDELSQAEFFPKVYLAKILVDEFTKNGVTLKIGRAAFLTPIWEGEYIPKTRPRTW